MAEISTGRIALEGAPNFRDVGGCRAADGRLVRRGFVYRSDSLATLSDNDVEVIRRLGIGLIVDLRSAYEKEIHPNRLPDGHVTKTLSIDINADVRAGNDSLFGILKANPTREGARQMLLASYRSMPENFSRHLPGLFDELVDDDCPPAVLHCTVGKDRTGFATAMLLSALGVSRQAIYEDYLATARYANFAKLRPALAEVTGFRLDLPADVAAIDTMLAVDEDYLGAALDQIEAEYDSIERYLQVVGKLTDDKRERLRARLLE